MWLNAIIGLTRGITGGVIMIYVNNMSFEYIFLSASESEISGHKPYCIIEKKETGEYWNGIEWQDSKANLTLTHVLDGIYRYQITFESEGLYQIDAFDTVNEQYDNLRLEILSGTIVSNGSTYEITRNLLADKNVFVSIQRDSDQLYWNGYSFQMTEQRISIPEVIPGIYEYHFKYEQEESFRIKITEDTIPVIESMSLHFRNNLKERRPDLLGRTINQDNITGTDGGNGVVKEETGTPMKDVEVLVYEKLTKEYYRASTDKFGRWRALVENTGDYICIFKKDGFVNTSIEKVVE